MRIGVSVWSGRGYRTSTTPLRTNTPPALCFTDLCRLILDGERDADAYLDLLRAGGSGDPIELIARAGVNMLDPEVLGNAFRRFDQTVAAVAEGR